MQPPGVLLDAGAGDGRIARVFASEVERVDAVDPSAEMIAVGKAAPGGLAPNLHWIEARIEEAPLAPPYGLATAGASFHWMDPEIVLPRLGEALAPEALLVLLDGDAPVDAPFDEAAMRVMQETVERADGARPKWWTNAGDRLARPMLDHPRFESRGVHITAPFAVSQSIDDFLRCEHSRQSFSESHLGPELTTFFDESMRAALEPFTEDGVLDYSIQTRIEWGRPR
jgi:SAM-dependent methyltransferase